MKRIATLVLLALSCALLSAADCGPPPEGADAGVDPQKLPPCAETATLFGLDSAGTRTTLDAGSELPIVRGFQGFEMVRIGLSSPLPLADEVDLQASLVVDGLANIATSFPAVQVRETATGFDSDELNLIVNDVPMPDLLGHPATLTISAATATCRLAGSATVTLVNGGTLADGGS